MPRQPKPRTSHGAPVGFDDYVPIERRLEKRKIKKCRPAKAKKRRRMADDGTTVVMGGEPGATEGRSG